MSAPATMARPVGAGTLRDRIEAAFRGGREFTADEMAAELDEPILNVRPQVSFLACNSRVIDTGARRKNSSGRNATVWKLV